MALLTIQTDDVGMTKSINEATQRAVQLGAIDAASLMVPCPNFDDIADFCASTSGCEWGVHFTMTCEWPQLRWGPISRATAVRSLCNMEGHFHSTIDEATRVATPEAVALELAAQIEAAAQRKIRLTYIDSHMYAIYSRSDLMAAYIEVAGSAGLLALIDGAVFRRAPLPRSVLKPHCVVIERTIRYTRSNAPSSEQWSDGYIRQLSDASGERNQLLLHVGMDDAESRQFLGHHNPYGAAWRARDTHFAYSGGLADALAQRGIVRCGWSAYAPLPGHY